MKRLVLVLAAAVLLGIIIWKGGGTGEIRAFGDDPTDGGAIVDIGDPQLRTIDGMDSGGVRTDEMSIGGGVADMRNIDGFDSGGVIADEISIGGIKLVGGARASFSGGGADGTRLLIGDVMGGGGYRIYFGAGSGCLKGEYPDGGEMISDSARFAGSGDGPRLLDTGGAKPVLPVLMVSDWGIVAPRGLRIGR